MTAITIALIVYVFSVWKNYNWIRIAYSKDGRYSNLDTDVVDIIVTLFPIVNTFNLAVILFESPYKYPKDAWNGNKFFNIKK